MGCRDNKIYLKKKNWSTPDKIYCAGTRGWYTLTFLRCCGLESKN